MFIHYTEHPSPTVQYLPIVLCFKILKRDTDFLSQSGRLVTCVIVSSICIIKHYYAFIHWGHPFHERNTVELTNLKVLLELTAKLKAQPILQ